MENFDESNDLEIDFAPPQEDYAIFDFNRPPFRFPTKEKNYSVDPIYPERDETWIYEMEATVFHALESFPAPPDELRTEHPLCIAHNDLLSAELELYQGIEAVKEFHPYFTDETGTAIERESVKKLITRLIGITSDNDNEIQNKTSKVSEKDWRWRHFRQKKIYLQKAMAYLYLYKAQANNPHPELADSLMHQTEATYIAHMAFAAVRSAVHEFKPRRKSGELVMDHVYSVCIHRMNYWLRLIKETNNPEEISELYHEMKLDIIRSLCHDYLEDFEDLNEEFLMGKLQELLQLDTNLEINIRKIRSEKTPKNTNFAKRNEATILRELKALIKTNKGERDIKRQIFEDLPVPSQIRTLLTKVADRMHNLQTLSSMPPRNQAAKVIGTIHILYLGIWALQKYEHPIPYRRNFTNELIRLNDTAIRESQRITGTLKHELSDKEYNDLALAMDYMKRDIGPQLQT